MRSFMSLAIAAAAACGGGEARPVEVPTADPQAPATPSSPGATTSVAPGSSSAAESAEGGATRIARDVASGRTRLAPEVIQRVIRAHFGDFRRCYEEGLGRSPSLSGRVVTKFVIARNGAVSSAEDSGSDIAERAVVDCVLSDFRALVFPTPRGGIVTVVYPIQFTPGDAPDAGPPQREGAQEPPAR